MRTNCCDFCVAADRQFTPEKASAELKRYRQKGPGPTTRLLRDGLAKANLLDGVLLDIGAGVGSLTFELLDLGMTRAVVVDASSAYLAAASDEALRRGRSDATQLVHGDFLDVAQQLPAATVVTLDRVICCYPLYEAFLEQALRHAERGFAFSYPKDRSYVRGGVWCENAMRRWRANPFRTFVHSVTSMERIVRQAGFDLVSRSQTWMWSADVYVRAAG